MRRMILAAVLGGAVMASPALAIEVPDYNAPVQDEARLLSGGERQQLTGRILDYRRRTGVEIGVLLVESLDGYAIEDFAHDVYNRWGIGSDSLNSGVLFVVAWTDRKARLEVGYGLEADLTDLEAGRIVSKRSPMADRFRDGDVAAGIESVLDGIEAAVAGDYQVTDGDEGESKGFSPVIVFLLIMAVIIVSRIARHARSRRKSSWTRGSWEDFWSGMGGMGSMGSWGGGSTRGSSGGFTFGGGSSGGGGASGGW